MQTSKISQETAKIVKATSSPRSTRSRTSTLSRFAHNALFKDEEPSEALPTILDIEEVVPSSRKRKRDAKIRTPTTTRLPKKTVLVKTKLEESVEFSPSKDRKVRKPARQIKNKETGEVKIHPPNDWAEVYAAVKEMRISGPAQNAAVDTMGCERLGQDDVSPKVKRYQTLTALMLSSQTKDTTNAIAMKRLQTELPAYKEGAPNGLNLENILAVDPKLLNELIWVVGFHNNKTKYIKAAAEILRDVWNGDIPDTIEGLMSLPGVGPKMAYLCMSTAWGRTEGIGVDVHVHRITNLWGWHKTKGPEESRLALQAWLPKELWHEINWALVGFGQTVCLPVGRKCGECDLGLSGLCKSAERSKVTIARKLREEKLEKDKKGDVVAVINKIKSEELVDMRANVDVKAELVEGAQVKMEDSNGYEKDSGAV